MKSNWFYWHLKMFFMAVAVNSESFYSINAPGVLKSNRKYSVVVDLHNADGPCLIRVGINGPGFNQFNDVNLQPFESKLIEFFPKKLSNAKYILRAESLSGLSFKNESSLHVITDEGPKIYIQTDKAIYKPQDTVRFRVLLLDEHTRPLNIKDPKHVEILDNAGNRVKQFKNLSFTHGVYTGKFKLSKYPVLGVWKIKVKIDGTYDYSRHKEIEIANYRLPKFRVNLKTPANVLLEDDFIKVIIYGKYTFDKYVEGNATVQLWDPYETRLFQTKQVNIQSLASVDFDIKNIKDIGMFDGLIVKANLTEMYTGVTESEEHSVNLRSQRYNLVIPYEEIEFENNKPYRINVYVKHWTGAPVLDRKTPVTMEHGGQIYKAFLDAKGLATFEFEHDAKADHKFQYKDSKSNFYNIYTDANLMLNSREYYCRLTLVDSRLRLGKPVLIEVSSIVDIPYLKYILMGHASIIKTEYIKVPSRQKSYVISITPSIEMIPISYIYVYYIHRGNLRYEEMFLGFPDEFENQVSISAPKQAKPTEDVTITINAQPKSYVSILAVDLGVNLLKNSYDLSKNEILSDLYGDKSYAAYASAIYPGIISGLVTFTNAHYPFKSAGGGFGGGGGSGKFPEKFQVRQKFPETWIFENYEIDANETKLTLQIPDTITTWRITAFSNNHETGFGIVNSPTDITTITPFFISINLPFSVKRGEIVTVHVTVFNYHNQTLETDVVLKNNAAEFLFKESNSERLQNSTDDQQQIKHVSIPANKAKTVNFLIYPLLAGEISISVTAESSLYSDAVLQKLKVEPEGVPKHTSQSMYLSIPEGEKITSNFSIEQQIGSVPESEYITFSVGGNYLVPTVDNFQDLTKIPTGSGEQNMFNFAPCVLTLQYLKANGKLFQEKQLVEELHSAIEISYQQQLSFRHENGGYSVFGQDVDEEPSTWLTAYVVRFFIKASKFFDIEEKVIETDLEYLAQQQTSNGEFSNTGYAQNPSHKNKYGLTAFILLAFLEDQKYTSKYEETIKNAVEFLNSNLDKVSDTNALCLIASVITRFEHQNANILINQLKSSSKENNGPKWWSANDQNIAKDVEVTECAALTLLDTPGDHTSILKWLIEQRNAKGGLTSTYNTVVGMEALVKFSEKYRNLKILNLKISYSATDEEGNEVASDKFFVDSNTVWDLQEHELPTTTRHVNFQMDGVGAALVQLSYKFNVVEVQEFRHFNIKPKVVLKNENDFDLEVCFTYQSDSNMQDDENPLIIMEANLPSGFRSDIENSLSESENDIVQRTESTNSESTIIFYLSDLKPNSNYCLGIPANKVNEVLMPKPAAITMYDYFNMSRSNTEFYTI